ncbi:MAG: alpha-amylase family glycosyl hydrolase [Candidatus Izemoplasma sp.]
MSELTKKELRNLFIYQVFVRNHTSDGTFKALINDLDRIKALNVDVIYLLPIHPIGELNRKGSLGSPYSIKDFRKVNSELGTLEDYKLLIKEIHDRNMLIMMDIVFNHTSYDSILLKEHPEYFYKVDGEFKNRVGDWWDITDFDYSHSADLSTELINTLKYWTKLGVDSYRFDVASLLPMEFLRKAKEEVLKLNPNTIFLSESVHGSFIRYIRKMGFKALSESEIFQVFDIAYDYDTHPSFESYLKGDGTLKRYLEELIRQEEVYPDNYIKMRNLENHDFGRIANFLNSDKTLINNWTSCMFFQKGSTMIYAAQEFSEVTHQTLFDKDPFKWTGKDISPLVTKLALITKTKIFSFGTYEITVKNKDIFYASYSYEGEIVVGIFNLSKCTGKVHVDLPEGQYLNLIDDKYYAVIGSMLKLSSKPLILKIK